MNHGSLFSGIGGFDLAAEWMGWENLFNCEWEEFPRKVLKHHFPNAEQYGDIREFNATNYAGRIDILSGGFPCQPFSVAGKRLGKEDERHLWPEMLRIIRECSPRWVVGENVRGLVNWSGGLVLEEVYFDLETLGYSVQSFIIPACATGAPHRRDRVWIVAYAAHNGCGRGSGEERKERRERMVSGECEGRTMGCEVAGCGGVGTSPDTDNERLQRSKERRGFKGSKPNRNKQSSRRIRAKWENFPTVSPLCGRDDGLPKRLDGITFSKWRRESIKAYGNAIVPQVAFEIFKSIKSYDDNR